MNLCEKLIYLLQTEMNIPKPFGWFHILWIVLVIVSLLFLYFNKNKYNDKQLKIVLAVYGVVALILEILKQISWSFNYNPITNNTWWSYEWYAAPFQLCTTPIYVSLICLFLKKGKIRNYLLSYIAYFTILGSIMTILMPDSCFVSDILVNIHTMYLHCGSFVVSVYLLFTNEVEVKYSNVLRGLLVFLIFVFIANTLNIIVYNSGILNGETFNMFYISPYFISHLPIYGTVQESIPYIFYLMFYIISIYLGSDIIFFISCGINWINKNIKSYLYKKQ